MLVDVPLLHLDRPFTYRVPPALAGQVHLGTRVKVPFGGRRRVDGWVVGRAPDLPPDARDLLRVVSPVPSFGPPELALFRWVADRYAAAVIDTLRLAIPPRVAAVEKSLEGVWTAESPSSGEASPLPRRADPAVHSPSQPAPEPLAAMVRGGLAGAVYWRPLPGEDRGARVIALIEAALARGRGAIVVTPEVAAGSAVGDAVRKAFPDAADLASDLSDRRRFRAWAELRQGRRMVVVGGRSSVLAPLPALGCVIVDDEANFAHKEQRSPRFHTREVALRRAATAGALCVLTGTVPSAEALAAMQAGQCRLLAPD
ncbi:MAG: hypothetical protein M3O65_12145, partial [Actinomycetota bacterium]|nr:hypothetical protein [Actinomycetota bacterium]